MQCRVCMQTNCSILLDMNASCANEGKSLFDYFNECTQLHASIHDNFPKSLCKICAQKLQIAYNFKKCARESDANFKKLLALPKKEPESVFVKNEEELNDDPIGMEFVCCSNEMELNENGNNFKHSDLEVSMEDISPEESLNTYFEEAQDEDITEKSIEIFDVPELPVLNEDHVLQITMVTKTESKDSLYCMDKPDNCIVPIRKLEYDCEICNCNYATKSELIKHTSEEHNSEIICVNCSKAFELPNELRKHRKLIHETDSPVHCDYCKETTSIPRSHLLEHFEKKHKAQYLKYFPRKFKGYKCKYCTKVVTCAVELEDHVKTHVLFKCQFCSKYYTTARTYSGHAMRVHNRSINSLPSTPIVIEEVGYEKDKRIECKICHRSYGNRSAYKKHIKQQHKTVKHGGKNLSNDIQPMEYLVGYVKSISTTHRKEINQNGLSQKETTKNFLHNKRLTEADRDGQESAMPNPDEIRENSKSKEKRYTYVHIAVARILTSTHALELHEGKQHLNKEIELKECPVCKKKFSSKYLSTHIDLVHVGKRKYTCDICGGSYKCRDTINRHKRLHAKECNFPCNVCDKNFIDKTELKVHMRVHTGERPFSCHLCDRRFRIRVHLSYHLQRHDNVKQTCKVCGKEFINSESLRNHSFRHSGIMPYMCLICDYGSAKRNYFVTHMLHKHDITMTGDELFAMFKANTGRSPRVKLAEELEIMEKNSINFN